MPDTDLTPQQMQVFLKYMLGWPRWRIAMSLGLADEQAVSLIIQSPAVQQAIADARAVVVAKAAGIVQRLEDGAELALDVVENVMLHGCKEENKLRAAFDWLDRAGHKPASVVNVNQRSLSASFNYHALSPEDRDAMRAVAERAARATALGSEE